MHLRLQDRLDRPKDGYCLDVMGWGRNFGVNVPVFAHNCKPGLTADSAVVFDPDGSIRFPYVGLCITVAGVNSYPLPGASILLRQCGVEAPFVGGPKLQRFNLHKDGRLELRGSGLCLSVGHRSERTYSPADRWRALFVEDCAKAEPRLSRWEFVIPPA